MKVPTESARVRIVNKIPESPTLPFAQEIELLAGEKVIARTLWFAPKSEDGVAQVLDLQVFPAYQRQGHGSLLMKAVYEQVKDFFARTTIKPRRVWLSVEQKQHINARAFLSRHGFHHVSSIENLHRKQDALIYLKAFD